MFVETQFAKVPVNTGFFYDNKMFKKVPEIKYGELTMNAKVSSGDGWMFEDNDTVKVLEKQVS